MTGYGFVNMEESKQQVVMSKDEASMDCANSICTKTYKVENQNLIQSGTFPIDEPKHSGSNILVGEPFNFFTMSPDGDFTKNEIDLWYYSDPEFKNITTSNFAYANEDKPIIISADFHWG